MKWQSGRDRIRLTFPDRKQGKKPYFTCVKLEIDKKAYDLPIRDGQQNLLTNAKFKASSVKDNNEAQYGSKGLFDNRGETAWETSKTDTLCTLEFDLGRLEKLASFSLAEKGQIENWNHGVDIQLKIKEKESDNWQTVLQRKGAIGSPPILHFKPQEARFIKMEIRKRASFELQIAELRLFEPPE